LALKYDLVLDETRQLRPRPLRRLHLIGGGSRNRLLCQLAADATGLTVAAGPSEATAIGNLLVQAMALGELADLAALRAVVRESFPVTLYEPLPAPGWASTRERFRALVRG